MTDTGHSAIIDIGSNSVRLVVYNGPKRAPAVLFNEKVMAGLGAGLASSGKLSPGSMRRALSALRRYHALVVQMGVTRLRVVATAAAREASNAQAFLDQIALLGLPVEVLSGEEEAVAAVQLLQQVPHPNWEMAVQLRASMGQAWTSRRCTYQQPPPSQLAEIRHHYGEVYSTLPNPLLKESS